MPNRCLFALSLSMLAPAALAGTSAPSFDLNLGLQPGAVKFGATFDVPYVLFPVANVTGFTDPDNPANTFHMYDGDDPVNPTFSAGPGGQSSTNFATVADLKSAVAANTWHLVITDGATSQTYAYSFTVDASNLTDDYVRPIVFTNFDTNSVIPASPTFNWSQASTALDSAQYTSASTFLNSATSYSASINPSDTSWSPGPVDPSQVYSFALIMTNANTPQDLVTASTPIPDDDTPSLESYVTSSTAFSEAFAYNLTVPAPGAATVGIVGAGALLRRRR